MQIPTLVVLQILGFVSLHFYLILRFISINEFVVCSLEIVLGVVEASPMINATIS